MLNKIKVQTKISIQILIFLAINFGIVSNSFGFTKIESKEFGRLFTTQEQRARMDNVLKSKSQLGVDRKITYRGIVKRKGIDWVWLNDQVLNARKDSALLLHNDRSLTIIVDEKPYRLKIGQTLIPALEQINDPIVKENIEIISKP